MKPCRVVGSPHGNQALALGVVGVDRALGVDVRHGHLDVAAGAGDPLAHVPAPGPAPVPGRLPTLHALGAVAAGAGGAHSAAETATHAAALVQAAAHGLAAYE